MPLTRRRFCCHATHPTGALPNPSVGPTPGAKSCSLSSRATPTTTVRGVYPYGKTRFSAMLADTTDDDEFERGCGLQTGRLSACPSTSGRFDGLASENEYRTFGDRLNDVIRVPRMPSL